MFHQESKIDRISGEKIVAWRKVTDDHTDIIISPQIARQGKLLRFLRSASLHFFVAFLPIFSTDPDPKTIDNKAQINITMVGVPDNGE